nr:MAG TPA_asm: hypothetical protein [Caudoviricetes sp.]
MIYNPPRLNKNNKTWKERFTPKQIYNPPRLNKN